MDTDEIGCDTDEKRGVCDIGILFGSGVAAKFSQCRLSLPNRLLIDSNSIRMFTPVGRKAVFRTRS